MAKKAYIGVGGVAHKIKKGYIGVGGEVYTPVEYIQSSGTQYLDTGIIGQTGIKVTGEFLTSNFSTCIPIGCYSSQRCYVLSFNGTHVRYGYVNWYTATKAITANEKHSFEVDFSANSQYLKIDGETLITSSETTSFVNSHTMFLSAYNDSGTAGDFSSIRWYPLQIYLNGVMVRDYVPCITSGGEGVMLDRKTGLLFKNNGTGAFTVGDITGDSETSSGVARKIKKAYIGVGGVARPCWGGSEIVYYGAITELSLTRMNLAATSVGNYALFGGGASTLIGSDNTVDAYNTALTRSTPTALSQARQNLAATTIGNYALFGGGYQGTSMPTSSVVDAYNTSLTRSTPTALSQARQNLAATTIGNYALFGGGNRSNRKNCEAVVDAYNASLTRSTPTALSVARRYLRATTVGSYAIFSCGEPDSGSSKVVDAYNESLTRTTPTGMTDRDFLAATSVGNYALFGGGYSSAVVDVYNASLTKSTATALSQARQDLAATTVGNYALFGGGRIIGASAAVYSTVDVYDESLTRTIATSLSQARGQLAATTVGNYALFGGGNYEPNMSAVVDAYTVV